jgi:hypothetical protein
MPSTLFTTSTNTVLCHGLPTGPVTSPRRRAEALTTIHPHSSWHAVTALLRPWATPENWAGVVASREIVARETGSDGVKDYVVVLGRDGAATIFLDEIFDGLRAWFECPDLRFVVVRSGVAALVGHEQVRALVPAADVVRYATGLSWVADPIGFVAGPWTYTEDDGVKTIRCGTWAWTYC